MGQSEGIIDRMSKAVESRLSREALAATFTDD